MISYIVFTVVTCEGSPIIGTKAPAVLKFDNLLGSTQHCESNKLIKIVLE